MKFCVSFSFKIFSHFALTCLQIEKTEERVLCLLWFFSFVFGCFPMNPCVCL